MCLAVSAHASHALHGPTPLSPPLSHPPYLKELGLHVLAAQHLEVLVHDLARPAVAVEVRDDALLALDLLEELLLLRQLGVGAVAARRPLARHLLLLSHLVDAPAPQALEVVVLQVVEALQLVVELVLKALGDVEHGLLDGVLRERAGHLCSWGAEREDGWLLLLLLLLHTSERALEKTRCDAAAAALRLCTWPRSCCRESCLI